MTEERKRGRPPSAVAKTGEREKTSTWPKIAINMRPETKSYLDAVCALEKRSAWMVIEDGIKLYLSSLSKEDRRLCDQLARRVTDPPSHKSSR